jgi:putative MFS transporter
MPLLAYLHIGWRGLYIIGALPILVVFFLARGFHESERFTKARESNEYTPGFFDVWKRPYLKYMVPICVIWILLYLCYTTGQNFLSYHTVTELGWNETQVGLATALAYTIGLLGYLTAGKLLDSIGRKPTAAIFLTAGSLVTILTFQAVQFPFVVLFAVVSTFFVGVFTVIGASFTNELFPTLIRANATAWGNNIAGRLGQIAAPAIVGSIAVPLGSVGNAVSVLALAPLAAVIIIMWALPETRNSELADFMEETGISM